MTREYEPIVKTATKIDVKPNLVDTVKLRHEFNYTITMDIKMDLKTEKTESVGMPIPCMAFNPVVAPDGNRSASSHSLNITNSIKIKQNFAIFSLVTLYNKKRKMSIIYL